MFFNGLKGEGREIKRNEKERKKEIRERMWWPYATLQSGNLGSPLLKGLSFTSELHLLLVQLHTGEGPWLGAVLPHQMPLGGAEGDVCAVFQSF